MSPAQRARRAQDDAGHWPTRANSSRPPNVHPEVWQTSFRTAATGASKRLPEEPESEDHGHSDGCDG
eukprot:9038092-Heterocapsa_arctica.AAC.1